MLVSAVKMATMFWEYAAEDQRFVGHFYVQKDSMQKDIRKEMFTVVFVA
jgi:hypothetical protein